MYINAIFNLEQLVSLNAFSDTNTFFSITFSSYVIIMFIHHEILLLKIFADNIHQQLL